MARKPKAEEKTGSDPVPLRPTMPRAVKGLAPETAPQPAARAAGPGHNAGPFPEEKRDEFLRFVSKIADADAEIAVLMAKRKQIRQTAKAAGFQLRLLDQAVAWAEDAREARAKMNTLSQFLGWLKVVPPGHQFSMFDDPYRPEGENPFDGTAELSPEQVAALEQDAVDAGWRAGRTNGDEVNDNPHDAASPLGQKWIGGFRAGRAEKQKEGEIDVMAPAAGED